MKRFDASKVKMSCYLTPLTEKQKAWGRKVRGTKSRFAIDKPVASDKPKERDFLAIVKAGYVPAKPRGRRGAYLSAEKRAALEGKRQAREAFFRSI